MTEPPDEQIVTTLLDAEEAAYPTEPSSDFWEAIHEHVIPLLEAEAVKGREEVERLQRRLGDELV
jgi:hypothetical protein